MNNSDFHHKALVAAASVVLAFGTGCFDPEKDDEPLDTEASVDDSASADDTSDTSSNDTADSSIDDRPDCSEVLDGEELMECCNSLGEWCAAEYGEESDEYLVCVYGPDYDGSTGCIPWGPPVPPRSTRKLA